MIEYASPIPEGSDTADIYLEPDGTLSFDWYKAEKIKMSDYDMSSIRREVAAIKKVVSEQQMMDADDAIQLLHNLDRLIGVVEDIDERITALEEQSAKGR